MSTYPSQVIHFIKGPPFRQETGDFKGVQYQEIIESSLAMGSIKGTVNLEETADFHTSVQTVSAPTQAHNVGPKNSSSDFQLYSLAHSPICISDVQKSLSKYPM